MKVSGRSDGMIVQVVHKSGPTTAIQVMTLEDLFTEIEHHSEEAVLKKVGLWWTIYEDD